MRRFRLGLGALLAIAGLCFAAAPAAWAQNGEFADAEIFFEFNSTDEDLGIHALIDGDAWKELEIEAPNGRELLEVGVKSRLKRQGLTELFFESAEPTFDELSPRRFFRRFPEGTYEIEGETLEGDELESDAELTHLLPAAPEPSVNGEELNEECVEVEAPVTVTWPEVEVSYGDDFDADEAGDTDGFPASEEIEINNYEAVVEVESADAVVSVILPPDVREVSIPEEITDLANGEEIKIEVLAREESFNQTAFESCFVVE